ncbi:rhamnogalacturonan acetylesterase [Mucilaginibacter mali]|uniref:Rhamnogalacturonan acetylesterase n=1 Tax=Mucilaginibacter mali TaxID=2740462 RepID=A0A7D4QRG6_9SPHI|nr:rhamnogalacturonan acetylesterase [Mucilaginibacter mali]QKJ29569.1 rhamnogalacturonan acetylesterase [Mucilaginibacter mali]
MKKLFFNRNAVLIMLIFSVFTLFSFALKPDNITVYMAGDSTMADKDVRTYPETGWGMPFKFYFDKTVTVVNVAKNGRSTKSFITEGLWQSIVDKLKAGDYVLVQFGHNDEVPTKKTATTETEFHDNLVRYVTETRAKQAIPILLTPVARRKFDANGKVQGTHDVYSEIVRKVAAEQKVPLIDHDRESQALLQTLGPESSKLLYNHLQPGENPNYPDGKIDDTHFSETGARKMAQIVLNDIKALKLDLADRIVKGANAATVAPAAK